jgi:hypothetical protein
MTEETNTKHQRIVKLSGLAVLLQYHSNLLLHLINNGDIK